MRKINLKNFFLLFLLYFNTCGTEDENKGSLTFFWELSGTTCSDANITKINVTLTSDNQIYYENNYNCKSNKITIENIAPGEYDLIVTAYNNENKPMYKVTVKVKVIKDQETNIGKVILKKIGGTLIIRWAFENGLLCSFNNIFKVNVVVLDEEGMELFNDTFPCDPFLNQSYNEEYVDYNVMGIKLENITTGKITVVCFGLDLTEIRKFKGKEIINLSIGETKQVLVKLIECDTSCY